MRSFIKVQGLTVLLLAGCAAQQSSQPLPTVPARAPATNEAATPVTVVEPEKSRPPLRDGITEVVVTGTLIRGSYEEAALPIDVISADDLAGSGSPSALDLLKSIPAVSATSPAIVNTERYQHFAENLPLRASEQPVSTLSIDVDTGSYANVRRHLASQALPPQDAVRVEEMINYFDYEYAQPAAAGAPFSVAAELAPAPWKTGSWLLKLGIQGRSLDAAARPPVNLVFLIDVSGSMQDDDKLPLLKRALRLLTEQLSARDRVAMVVYAGNSGIVLEPTPGDQRGRILAALERLEAGGSTNGAGGITQAYQLARTAFTTEAVNRVVLATDGDFNVGVTNFQALLDIAKRERTSGIALTTLGFGTGNYNDELLEQLADAGDGNYAYVDSLAEARKVLVKELSATLVTIAKDVKLQIEFNPQQVLEYRLIGYQNRVLARADFNNDAVDAGEIGAGHRVTALYEIVPVGGQASVDSLRYAAAVPQPKGPRSELAYLRLRYKEPKGKRSRLLEVPIQARPAAAASVDFKFAASVAAFGELLRGGKYQGEFGYAQVAALASSSLGTDRDGYRQEFLGLVKQAETLAARQSGAQQVGDLR